MKYRFSLPIVLMVAVAAFLGGYWINRAGVEKSSHADRKILHYVDPMHPSYKSDKPGIAPDCGMQLEPVYADGAAGGGAAETALPPGTVRINEERQQLIGVKTATVEKAPWSHSMHATGRVVPDETRIFRINAAVPGWVKEVAPVTTGDLVHKNQLLGKIYATEFYSNIQQFIFSLESVDRLERLGGLTEQQRRTNAVNLEAGRNTLRNLGMSDLQLDEIARTRQFVDKIDIRALAPGFVIYRNISLGQRFDQGFEFFRIADLSKVWILADTYGSEADQLKPGTLVKISTLNRNRVYSAKVSAVPPIFDQNSRTLKVRLELNNPGLILRPDMFVDVELPIRLPPTLSVPVEALLDSGLKKTVFVEKGTGIFEPREVTTGRSFGNRVEIVSGLRAGERIAISGTFLLDSESRMKSAATGISGTPRQDPVCGMYIDEAKARAAGLTVDSGGVTHFFCSVEDKNRFLKNPAAKMPMPVSPAPPLQQAKPAAQMRKAGHKAHAPAAPEARPAEEHAGHQMPESTPTPQAPATPHGSGMKHD